MCEKELFVESLCFEFILQEEIKINSMRIYDLSFFTNLFYDDQQDSSPFQVDI